MSKIPVNAPCPCNSGRKYKKCCGSGLVQPDGTRMIAYNIKLLASGAPVGVDNRPDNPVARAAQNLMHSGQRFTSAAHATVVEAGVLRWLGMFVLTEGRQVVFFPGFTGPFDRMAYNTKDGGEYDEGFVLDHITLEANRQRWHMTQKVGSSEHRSAGRTLDVAGGHSLWFSISTSQPEELRPVLRETVASAPPPSNANELQNRVQAFMRAVGQGQSTQLHLPPRPSAPTALHFLMTVAKTGVPDYSGPEFLLPPSLAAAAVGSSVDGRCATVRLGPDTEIRVLAAWMPGTVERGFMFMAVG